MYSIYIPIDGEAEIMHIVEQLSRSVITVRIWRFILPAYERQRIEFVIIFNNSMCILL